MRVSHSHHYLQDTEPKVFGSINVRVTHADAGEHRHARTKCVACAHQKLLVGNRMSISQHCKLLPLPWHAFPTGFAIAVCKYLHLLTRSLYAVEIRNVKFVDLLWSVINIISNAKVCIPGIQGISLSQRKISCYEASVFVGLLTRRKAILSEYSTYPYTQSYYTLKGWRTHFICTLQDIKLHVVDIAAFPVKLSHLLVVVVIEVMVVVLAF